MIVPTVGRIMLYRPYGNMDDHALTLGAFVCKVWPGGTSVNLSVCSEDGGWYGAGGVRVLAEGEKSSGPCAHWMPYQVKVAKGEIEPTLHATSGRVVDNEAELERQGKGDKPWMGG